MLMVVAPRVGAWIEIYVIWCQLHNLASLPVWERGLKLNSKNERDYLLRSLPVWERGLKFRIVLSTHFLGHVAPRVGAWIEIY